MKPYQILPITPDTYHKCNNIWDMSSQPLAQNWLDEIIAGTRIPYAVVVDDEFVGECALVLQSDDPQYTIQGKRAYLSRLLVKDTMRHKGIGGLLVDHVVLQAKQQGFAQISVGVDKDNHIALHLYQSKGFTEVLFEGEDEYGAFFKLLKTIQ